MKGFFLSIMIVGLLPVFAHAGIRTESEEAVEGAVGKEESLIKEQTDYYMEAETYEVLPNNRQQTEIYTGIGVNQLFNENQTIMALEPQITTLSGDEVDHMLKSSYEYEELYQETLKKKTELVHRHEKEKKEKGDTLVLRKRQIKELMALTDEGKRYRELEKKAYAQERLLVEQQELAKFQKDSQENFEKYGFYLPESELRRRTFNRIQKEVEELKKYQAENRDMSLRGFDKDSRQIMQRGRLDDELHKAHAMLQKAKAKEKTQKHPEK